MKKIFFSHLILSLLIISCSNDNDIQEPSVETFTYNFNQTVNSVEENNTTAVTIGTLEKTGDLTFTSAEFVTGANIFAISNSNVQVKAGVLDFESGNTHEFILKLKRSGKSDITLNGNISVTEVNENTFTYTLTQTVNSIDENNTASVVIGMVNKTGTLDFTLSEFTAGGNAFELVGNNVQRKPGADYEDSTNDSFTLVLKVSGHPDVTLSGSVGINDVDEVVQDYILLGTHCISSFVEYDVADNNPNTDNIEIRRKTLNGTITSQTLADIENAIMGTTWTYGGNPLLNVGTSYIEWTLDDAGNEVLTSNSTHLNRSAFNFSILGASSNYSQSSDSFELDKLKRMLQYGINILDDTYSFSGPNALLDLNSASGDDHRFAAFSMTISDYIARARIDSGSINSKFAIITMIAIDVAMSGTDAENLARVDEHRANGRLVDPSKRVGCN